MKERRGTVEHQRRGSRNKGIDMGKGIHLILTRDPCREGETERGFRVLPQLRPTPPNHPPKLTIFTTQNALLE